MVALSLIVLYSGWWWLTARGIAAKADRWIAAEQAKGAQISPGSVKVRGYPLGFSIKVEGVKLTLPDGFGFASQQLAVRARPWSLSRFKVTANGGFAFNLPPGSARPALTLTGETIRGGATFRDGALPLALDVTADSVSASRTAVEGQAGRELSAATIEVIGSRPKTPPIADTDEAFNLSVRLLDVSGQALEANPLGATIKELLIHARLLGPPPANPDAAGFRAWRDAGGSIDAPEIKLDWGPLAVTGAGTAALDKDMQPEGAFTIHLSGFEPALNALAAANWIKLSSASIANLALGVAAHPGPDGKPTVDTPLTIQNQRLSLGPVKIGKIPTLQLD